MKYNEKTFELKLSAEDMGKIDQAILLGNPYKLERDNFKFKGIIKMNLNKKK